MKELSLHNCRLDRRYDVTGQLGRGSYAEIFLARDILASPQSTHSTVVIKALNVFLQGDLDADLERTLVENFQNEAVALDRVRHPNIISRLGHGTARDLLATVFHYLVLEYMAGGDIQSLIRKGGIAPQQALGYIEQVCAGLDHAHRHSIIHRDIKPQNLLLNWDLSTVKIADFGVARVNVSDAPITRVGTNIYAPPEHSPFMAGQTGDLDRSKLTPAADIYSLAKTIYSIMSGESPRVFANEPISILPEKVRSEQWAEDLLRVLKRATASEPLERHQSIIELWGDLATVRQIVAEGEYSTVMKASIPAPQPHVARGYSPVAPDMPRFDPITDRPSRMVADPIFQAPLYEPPTRLEQVEVSSPEGPPPTADSIFIPNPNKRGRGIRRFAAFSLLVVAFTGILYGTASFVRGRVMQSGTTTSPRGQVAIASTDIYLRPTPSTDHDPVGLVTKNSRVRIVNSQNNWYQVDVVQQGRDRGTSAGSATRGWLNGKYVQITN